MTTASITAMLDSDRKSPARLLVAIMLAMLIVCIPSLAKSDEPTAVDLQLILAVDVSGSVNQTRFELQKRGYVAAFRDARVLNAIRSGNAKAIAVTMVQWTGPTMQVQLMPWTLVNDGASVNAFADRIADVPRQLFGGGTSISGVIDYAVDLFRRAPFSAGRRVIDVSGDGANNRGRPAEAARDDATKAGIVINGLPILEVEPDLEEFYRRNVIGGPNAFVIAVSRFDEFGDAIIRKLILEIAATGQSRIKLGLQSTDTSAR